MFEDMTKSELYAIIAGVFTACLLISNIIAGKTFSFSSFTLPCGVIIFPVVYIINDVLAEVYGYHKARRVILLGFFMNLVAVICFNITIWLPAPSFFENSEAFSIVLGSTLRLLVAGFAAYIVGSLVNAKIMVYLKRVSEERLFLRCIVSTFFGEGLDALDPDALSCAKKEFAQKLVSYGETYLDIFPNGKAKTAVQNAINQAKAEL